ncbi:heavy-metal-associated domain-containing protein [Flagellimonas meishanensis]|uniref:heavy-metal-associated domain-containing protein n=1 Tax=Flagellimonas meishanensis TaxID=2873264 RepID=UPI001CA6AB4E|nr:heavy metal-associated domain-containing protein [[Muricauda] meishanensis]
MMTTIVIQNLKCGGCANTIKRNLEKLDGLSKVQVNLEKNEVVLQAVSNSVMERAKESLKHMGYPAVGDDNSFSTKAKSFMSCATGRLSQH